MDILKAILETQDIKEKLIILEQTVSKNINE